MITEVHVNKWYPNSEVRHLELYPQIKTTISGQYASSNFEKLLSCIGACYTGKIIFVDTRRDTHFELNGRIVCLKKEDNTHKSSSAICAREEELVTTLLNTQLIFEGKIQGKEVEHIKETVESASTVKNFVENKKFRNHEYVRLALDEHGPMTDEEVDTFLLLLDQIQSEKAWFHANSIVGGAAAALVMTMKAIRENARDKTLNEVIEELGRKAKNLFNDPKSDDINKDKKIARSKFIRDFYTYCKENLEISWSEWRKK